MNSITQHIPGFADSGQQPDRAEFSTLEELERIPFVARWKTPPDGATFYRFSKSDRHLMAELNSGSTFWVVGYLADADSVDLPTWRAPSVA